MAFTPLSFQHSEPTLKDEHWLCAWFESGIEYGLDHDGRTWIINKDGTFTLDASVTVLTPDEIEEQFS